MNKKPKRPAPPATSKSFIRSKEEQQKIMESRQREEAAVIAKIECFFERIMREEAKATARARAQAKAQNLSAEETEALIKQAIEVRTERGKPQSPHAWKKGGSVAPVSNTGESRSELSRLLGIGKRD
ncbi:MAG: hypothetical protein CFE27_07325 [Alphaproteobacteria bacterium PA1]|nr:MAG: hypothetical protein CFE27_07325 [Alphaproteobacteria bacterium PA1]